ncbi:hypothetical protein, partial [Noviherbaspirillum pedocola]|uniref:hypothetical protein n=1 Tax=Noviherbaspirillum pedocola TaxID=2801341 RepID=UPI001F22FF8D
GIQDADMVEQVNSWRDQPAPAVTVQTGENSNGRSGEYSSGGDKGMPQVDHLVQSCPEKVIGCHARSPAFPSVFAALYRSFSGNSVGRFRANPLPSLHVRDFARTTNLGRNRGVTNC